MPNAIDVLLAPVRLPTMLRDSQNQDVAYSGGQMKWLGGGDTTDMLGQANGHVPATSQHVLRPQPQNHEKWKYPPVAKMPHPMNNMPYEVHQVVMKPGAEHLLFHQMGQPPPPPHHLAPHTQTIISHQDPRNGQETQKNYSMCNKEYEYLMQYDNDNMMNSHGTAEFEHKMEEEKKRKGFRRLRKGCKKRRGRKRGRDLED
ncbi:hypothetical protein LSTR_LSTR012328 [Laodelphax striatellus]|uniref:Uncharacterized protein n=1 Tax=Laodelphax striatellus TaxID=195883 RepID=A0A482WSR1_LAOST|nr:hypothetical protein LSTR_LSTR012328 [Laodelphax striatellus]